MTFRTDTACSALALALLCSCGGGHGWEKKATPNERLASEAVGGFSDDDRRLYHQGIQHILNKHQKVGSFTIGQVIDQERGRESQRADIAARQKERAKVSYDEAHGPRTVDAACTAFNKKLDHIEGIGQIVKGTECRGSDRSVFHVDVTIRDEAWTSLTYDQRLRLAKSLWEGAVGAARLNQSPDSAHVRLIGEAGESLGGSNSFAGSMIDVNKD